MRLGDVCKIKAFRHSYIDSMHLQLIGNLFSLVGSMRKHEHVMKWFWFFLCIYCLTVIINFICLFYFHFPGLRDASLINYYFWVCLWECLWRRLPFEWTKSSLNPLAKSDQSEEFIHTGALGIFPGCSRKVWFKNDALLPTVQTDSVLVHKPKT